MGVRKSDCQAKANERDQAPLHLAVRYDADGVLRLLVEVGAGLDWTSPGGLTLLHVAAERGNPRVAAELIEAGLSVAETNEFGLTPLHMAARDGHAAVVQTLLEKGADPLATSRDARTPRDWTHDEQIQTLLWAAEDKGKGGS